MPQNSKSILRADTTDPNFARLVFVMADTAGHFALVPCYGAKSVVLIDLHSVPEEASNVTR